MRGPAESAKYCWWMRNITTEGLDVNGLAVGQGLQAEMQGRRGTAIELQAKELTAETAAENCLQVIS